MNEKRGFLDIINEHLASEKTRLPVFNQVGLRVQREVAKEDPDVSKIEKLIVCDQALTSQVLKTANSSFFRGMKEVSTVRDAIARLGTKQISNLIILVTQHENFRSRDPFVRELMGKLWRHSVGCAIGSLWLAKQCGFSTLLHEAFVAGLLHDAGKLFLLTVIEDIKRSGNTDFQLSHELVNEVMNSLHTEQGYLLLKNWSLPETYCEVAREHHNEELDSNNLLLVGVRLVDQACNKAGIGLFQDPSLVLAATPEAQVLGLSDLALAELEIKLEDSIAFSQGI